MPVCCEQEETSILRRIAVLLAGQQAAFAHGATTATFDRDDSARHRARERELTNLILSWVVLRQEFQRSAGFLRSSLLTEIRQVSSDVDAIVEQNHLASVLSEVVQALQDGEQEGPAEPTYTSAAAAAAVTAAPRSCAAQAAAQQLPAAVTGAAGGGAGSYSVTPTRRRGFCLSVGVTERPAKKAKAPRGKQGTPHPRVSAVQRAIDSADDLDLDSADDLDLSDLEAEGIPVEELLSPEAGAVDFGPRTDQEEQGDSDSDCNRRGADKNA